MDLEANSLYAYRERVCLVQISTAHQDYIVDPLAGLDLEGLGELAENPAVEKIFHAAEYDLMLMKREYGWQLRNLFDTMWAARILGYAQVGLANILNEFYGVTLDKRYQKANWCRRPLLQAQLTYAQSDTHYLLSLRQRLAAELEAAGRLPEAQEIFEEQTHVEPASNVFDPDSFWFINGVRELDQRQQAIVRALYLYRDQEARRQDRPHFKIFGDRTLMELAETEPKDLTALQAVHGMSLGQIKRYGRQMLQIIRDSREAPAPQRPRHGGSRPPQSVLNRYERLHTWRKKQARARGVESDVILSREAMWELAQANPKTPEELAQIKTLGPWRRTTYGNELLRVLKKS